MLDTSLACWTPPLYGVPPHMSYSPHSLVGFPVHLYVLGISTCVMGNIPLILRVWACSPICWGFWGHQYHCMSICFILYLLVVHYVSHIYHSYNHYSSSYSGVLWAVICFISDCASFHDGASCSMKWFCHHP